MASWSGDGACLVVVAAERQRNGRNTYLKQPHTKRKVGGKEEILLQALGSLRLDWHENYK